MLLVIALISLLFHIGISCYPTGSSQKVEVGKSTYFCIYLMNLEMKTTGKYLQLPIKSSADKLTKVRIQNGWTSSNYTNDILFQKLGYDERSDTTGNVVFVASMGTMSYPRIYRQQMITNDLSTSNSSSTGVAAVTFPMLFAMIIVENGKVKSIAWDNFCSWCDDRHCAPNTVNYDSQLLSNGPNCFLSDDQCYHRQEAISDDTNNNNNNNPANVTITSNQLCELTVYIAWEGTDVNGINFNSAAYRFSRWTTDQIGNFTSSLEERIIVI